MSERRKFDAVICDMDGVVTDSARVHANAWKALFDEYLDQRALSTPFDLEADYRQYVDGRTRYDGVRSFLASRGVELPEGATTDSPDEETVCGLGNRKDRLFADILRLQGVDIFPTTVQLLTMLQQNGIRLGVASSSRNCRLILGLAGLEELFAARVDGEVSAELGMSGKPDPGIFLECADRLGAAPERAIVIEDALSGVRAGRAGGFLLVIGIDRSGIADQLRRNGADVVVPDLAGVTPERLDRWCVMHARTRLTESG